MGRVFALALLALVFASAGAAAGGGGSATGGAHLTVHDVFGLQTLELQTFAFTARAAADGSADGWFTYRELDDGAPFSANGPVTCLTVIGRDAWIGGVISRSNDPTYNGLGAWWHVTDNHDTPGTEADITTFMGVGTLADTQAFCAAHPAYRHPFPIDGGNIEVRD